MEALVNRRGVRQGRVRTLAKKSTSRGGIGCSSLRRQAQGRQLGSRTPLSRRALYVMPGGESLQYLLSTPAGHRLAAPTAGDVLKD